MLLDKLKEALKAMDAAAAAVAYGKEKIRLALNAIEPNTHEMSYRQDLLPMLENMSAVVSHAFDTKNDLDGLIDGIESLPAHCIMSYNPMLGWHGVTKDGRRVTVDPDLLPKGEQDMAVLTMLADDWAVLDSPAVHVYCGLCGDSPEMDDSENIGEDQICQCPCHEDGIARAAKKGEES